jgi:hypothetical protein
MRKNPKQRLEASSGRERDTERQRGDTYIPQWHRGASGIGSSRRSPPR